MKDEVKKLLPFLKSGKKNVNAGIDILKRYVAGEQIAMSELADIQSKLSQASMNNSVFDDIPRSKAAKNQVKVNKVSCLLMLVNTYTITDEDDREMLMIGETWQGISLDYVKTNVIN